MLSAIRRSAGLLVLVIGLIVVELVGGYLLWKYSLQRRAVRVSSLQSMFLADTATPPAIYRTSLAHAGLLGTASSRQLYLRALWWTMNQASAIGDNPRGHDPEQLLRAVQNGQGALCSHMARLYTTALTSLGLPSRTVWLFRNFPGGDTHTSVEVLIDGKWVILDPTFGVYYRDNTGHLLSARDIQARLFKGDYRSIEPVFVGRADAKYPARLSSYYMNFLPLFNNVFVMRNESNEPWWAVVPPLRYWFGQPIYFQGIAGAADNIAFVQGLYLLVIVLLPVVLIVLAAVLVIRIGVEVRRQTAVRTGHSPLRIEAA